MDTYVIGIDQSTQGTKALVFDQNGTRISRADRPHRQIITERGWVEHDGEEIFQNVKLAVAEAVKRAGIDKNRIAVIGISNQRETTAVWRKDGTPLCNAIVWQCARGKDICSQMEERGLAEEIREISGIPLSPYYPAAKLSWVLQNIPEAAALASNNELYCGTIDTWLVYRLTKGKNYVTDYSNASRTQLFDIKTLKWSSKLCSFFGVPIEILPEVTGSDALLGETDLDGYLDHAVPVHAALGDSHAALFGQGCHAAGMIKATYGTGSSVMMNVGSEPVKSTNGLVTSLAWGMDGTVTYVLEGNINYTGAVITWMQKDLGLIERPSDAEVMAKQAAAGDKTYFVPAFTGLGAPYWDSEAQGIFCGITRMTGKNELVKAGLSSIAYQIFDVVSAMEQDAGIMIPEVRVDGGPTANRYLMQLQSDLLNKEVLIPGAEELSCIGAAYAAGIAAGIFCREDLFSKAQYQKYQPEMNLREREEMLEGWHDAVRRSSSEGMRK